VEDDDFGYERGDCQAVAVTGGLGRMEQTLHGGACVDYESKIVDVDFHHTDTHLLVFSLPLALFIDSYYTKCKTPDISSRVSQEEFSVSLNTQDEVPNDPRYDRDGFLMMCCHHYPH
jgi:hypothetical protein